MIILVGVDYYSNKDVRSYKEVVESNLQKKLRSIRETNCPRPAESRAHQVPAIVAIVLYATFFFQSKTFVWGKGEIFGASSSSLMCYHQALGIMDLWFSCDIEKGDELCILRVQFQTISKGFEEKTKKWKKCRLDQISEWVSASFAAAFANLQKAV